MEPLDNQDPIPLLDREGKDLTAHGATNPFCRPWGPVVSIGWLSGLTKGDFVCILQTPLHLHHNPTMEYRRLSTNEVCEVTEYVYVGPLIRLQRCDALDRLGEAILVVFPLA